MVWKVFKCLKKVNTTKFVDFYQQLEVAFLIFADFEAIIYKKIKNLIEMMILIKIML